MELSLYMFLVLVGALIIVIDLFFGGILDIFDIDFGVPWINLKAIIFVCVFFGSGGALAYMAGLSFPLRILSAILSLGIGLLIVYLLFRLFRKLQYTSTFSNKELEGMECIVTEEIPNGGVGKVKVVVKQIPIFFAAKGEGGEGFSRGTAVTILTAEISPITVKKGV